MFATISYFTIPITLVYFVRKRRDVPFNWIFVCFGVFILSLPPSSRGWLRTA